MSLIINGIVEIPKGSNVKYEIENNQIKVDRLLFKDFKYPVNYGFIPFTLDYDGDPLDVLIIGNASIIPSAHVELKIVGAMKMIDEGETDTKLIAFLSDDPNNKDVKSLQDVDPNILQEIKEFFSTYKNYKNAKIVIDGFEDVAYAKSEFETTKKLWEKFRDLPKDQAIAKMKELYPDKYLG